MPAFAELPPFPTLVGLLALLLGVVSVALAWNASRPFMSVPTCPTNSSIGAESCIAVCTPIEALVAPGPRVTKHSPGCPVSLPQAAAMKAAPPSFRHSTKSL